MFLNKTNFYASIFIEREPHYHFCFSSTYYAVLCKIFVNNVLNNKYFITLNFESIEQHFDEC